MTKDEALDLALEIMHNQGDVGVDEWRAAEAAIKQARSAPVQEPVAWATRERFYEALDRAVENARQEMRIKTVTMRCKDHDIALPLVDAYRGHVLVAQVALPAAQRQWVGLTDEQIDLFINGRGDEDDDDYVEPTGDGYGLTDADLVKLVRRAEAKLKEKNT